MTLRFAMLSLRLRYKLTLWLAKQSQYLIKVTLRFDKLTLHVSSQVDPMVRHAQTTSYQVDPIVCQAEPTPYQVDPWLAKLSLRLIKLTRRFAKLNLRLIKLTLRFAKLSLRLIKLILRPVKMSLRLSKLVSWVSCSPSEKTSKGKNTKRVFKKFC